MAAPSVAGSAAVVAQYIQENGLAEKNGLQVRTLAIALLMGTAEPLIDDTVELPYSPRLQGAGLSRDVYKRQVHRPKFPSEAQCAYGCPGCGGQSFVLNGAVSQESANFPGRIHPAGQAPGEQADDPRGEDEFYGDCPSAAIPVSYTHLGRAFPRGNRSGDFFVRQLPVFSKR